MPFSPGFPYNVIVRILTLLALDALALGRRLKRPLQGDGSGYRLGYALAEYFDKWPASQAIRPTEVKIKAPHTIEQLDGRGIPA